jgi:translocation and assembly module TamB
MRRHAIRLLLALLLGTVPILAGLVLVLTLSGSGRALLARVVGAELDGRLRGRFEVGAISGSFLRDLTLERVTVRDTTGALLASLPRAKVRYRLSGLLVGRVVLTGIVLDRPVIHITKHRAGRLNFQEVLRLGEGPPGGPSPLVEFRNVRVVDGTLRISLPWSPPDTARTEAQRQAALAADRARPGRVIEDSREGLQHVLLIAPLDVVFRRILISSPDHEPLTFDIDSLSTRVNDPAVTITSAVIRGWTRADSLAITVTRATLPNTSLQGGGVITWPNGPLQYDCAFVARRLDLVDLRWISADFPALSGSALVGMQSASDARTAYALRELRLSGGAGRVEGDVTVLTDLRRGLGVEGMRLDLTDLDLDAVRPYLDTLPFHGTLTGSLAGAGFFDSMNVDLDWRFRDARVEDHPESRIVLEGHVQPKTPAGFRFDRTEMRLADVDLRTARLIVPAVVLPGRVRGSGTLDGTFNLITFDGTLEHQDGERPRSDLTGRVTLDSRRDTLGLAMDVQLSPLDFDGIRRGFPSLTSRGTVSGHVRTAGFADRLEVEAELSGELGTFQASGHAAMLPPRWGADSLALDFHDLDLAALRGHGPTTRLQGHLLATGVIDTLVAPRGTLEVRLGPGSVREFGFDTAWARAGMADSVIRLDTLTLQWLAGSLEGTGTLGWNAGHDGEMRFTAAVDSLVGLDSLVLALSGQERDTTVGSSRLEGRAHASLGLTGSLDSLAADLQGAIEDVAWQQGRTSGVAGRLQWNGGRRPRLAVSLASDSISVRRWVVHDLDFTVGGWVDSLDWGGRVVLGQAGGLRGGGSLWRPPGAPAVLEVDSLTAALPSHLWQLNHPGSVVLADSVLKVTPVALEARDGSGSIRVGGGIPRQHPGSFSVTVLGLELQDVYQLLQWDTTGVAGRVALDLAIGGTADAPTIQGTASLADARFEDFKAPFMQGVINYGARSLEANLLVWRSGDPVLRIEARLPIDLALKAVPRRRAPGTLEIRGTADSTDLGVVEAFTPVVRGVRGVLNADAALGGTWERPELSGYVSVGNASFTLPGLGVRYSGISGRARLVADSILLDTLRLSSGRGNAQITGAVRLEDLTRPVLGLRLNAREFRAVDIRNLLTLEASGNLQLTGPVVGARLTGDLTANTGALHFADLITKRIVNLESVADSELIDRTLIRKQKLGEGFRSRFLDSLVIEDLRLTMGEAFWLRSSEANIQLDGSLTVNKVRQNYRIYGTLTALRGTYALKIGPVTRTFIVERGNVRYFGTPDLNADLDIAARYTVRTVPDNEEIPVIANITGTMLAPKLTLTSDQHPPLSETELVSYLMFGQPSFGLASGNSTQGTNQLAAVNTAVSYLSSALSNELQRTLATDLGVPIDYIEIKPGQLSSSTTNQTGVTSVAQVAAGWQLGRSWFVTVNADVCTNRTQLYPKAEYRISKEFRVKATVEPSLYCTDVNPAIQSSVSRYQIGFDLLWQREF